MLRLRALVPCVFFAVVLTGCGSSGSAATVQPAVTVNGHNISLSDFSSEYHSERISEAASAGYDVCAYPSLQSACLLIKQRALNAVINHELIREYARQHGLTLSPAEEQQRWALVFRTRFHSQQAVVNAFARHTGETPAYIRQSVLNDELQQRVLYQVTANDRPSGKAVRIARLVTTSTGELKVVRRLFAQRQPFLYIARYLTHVSIKGCSKTRCGDLGWVPYEFIGPDKQPLKTLALGGIFGPLVGQSQDEFFQVEARQAHYVFTPQQEYAWRQQQFGIWLQQRRQHAQVRRYVTV